MRWCWVMIAIAVWGGAPLVHAAGPVVDDPSKNIPLPAKRGAATQTASGTSLGTTGDPFELKRVVIALAVVVGLILVSQKAWKKLGMPGVASRGSGSLQVVSKLSVSPKQQVLLIRVGRRMVLVGNSGAQLNPLCEIDDPEEVAAILGQNASEKHETTSASFDDVLGSETREFESQSNAATGVVNEAEAASLDATRDEISGMMEKVRNLSQQFRRPT